MQNSAVRCNRAIQLKLQQYKQRMLQLLQLANKRKGCIELCPQVLSRWSFLRIKANLCSFRLGFEIVGDVCVFRGLGFIFAHKVGVKDSYENGKELK